MASKPYTMHIRNQVKTFDLRCIQRKNIAVYRDERFTVLLLARDQVGITSTTVTAITSENARLESYQTSQPLTDDCHLLSYTLYSTDSHERVVLFPDGPCRDTGLARVVLDVTLLPCPDGFTLTGEVCTCEERLHHYTVNCTVSEIPHSQRQ